MEDAASGLKRVQEQVRSILSNVQKELSTLKCVKFDTPMYIEKDGDNDPVLIAHILKVDTLGSESFMYVESLASKDSLQKTTLIMCRQVTTMRPMQRSDIGLTVNWAYKSDKFKSIAFGV